MASQIVFLVYHKKGDPPTNMHEWSTKSMQGNVPKFSGKEIVHEWSTINAFTNSKPFLRKSL